MCRLLSKMLIWIVAGVLCFCFNIPDIWAQDRVLTKDSKLHPQGWSVGEEVEFKKNTTILLNDNGEVISGTLVRDTFLWPRGRDRVIDDYYFVSAYARPDFMYFRRHYLAEGREYNIAIPAYGHLLYKKGTQVVFSEQGEVLKGTIARKATIILREDKYGFITFKADSVLEFYESGSILSGTLDDDTYLRPVGWKALIENNNQPDYSSAGFVKFSKGSRVEFNEQAELVSGTLKEPAMLFSADGTMVEYPANTYVKFNEQGFAEKYIS